MRRTVAPRTPATREDWRARYVRVHDELEERKRQWTRQEHHVQREILRLAVSYTGVDPDFDGLLTSLRDTLRRGADDQTRRTAIDEVLRSLAALGIRRTAPAPAGAGQVTAASLLVALLDQINVPDACVVEIRQLRARLSDTSRADDPAALVRRIAELLGEACAGASESVASGGAPHDAFGTFLERLRLNGDFGLRLVDLRRRAAGAQDHDARLALVDDAVTLLTEAIETRRGGVLDTEAVTVAEVALVLGQLLDWMCLPRTVAERAERIRTRLAGDLVATDITAVLKDIAGLVADLRADLEGELATIEAFLREIVDRIADFDVQLLEALGTHEQSVADGRSLREELHAELAAMQAQEDTGAEDIAELRKQVKERFARIDRSFGMFVERQQRRHSEAQSRVSTLTSQLKDLDARALQLQSALASERRNALTDGLTGIANRRALDRRLAEEHERWRRYGGSLSIAIIDIDHFKRVNDEFGHRAGDKVLTSIAELVRARIRGSDFLGRYGGEEFVVLLPQTPLQAARSAIEALRVEIAGCHFHYRGTPVPVTVSAGLAEIRAGDGVTSLIERADRALYRAKSLGRNCTMDETELTRGAT
ncbi:MAG: diguanylate cyclase [Gammaproteobacteria bacterium]|nr:diguanylate cyclase [Gammaproteobacteria bacterium]